MDGDRKIINVCRICLQSNISEGKYISLFERYKTSSVFDHITSIANVTIFHNDGFPDKICSTCLLDLDTAINFKQRCETSHTILQRSLHQIVLTNGESSKVKVKEEDDFEVDYLEPEEFFTCDLVTEDTKSFDVKDIEVEIDYPKEQLPQCDDCGQFFKSKCKLRVHWKKVHKLKSFVCPICKRLFKSFAAYSKHLKMKQRSCMEILNGNKMRIEGEGKSRMFCCSHCDYKSNRYIHTKAHLVVHSGLKPFKCNLCSKAYTQRGSLDMHKQIMHPNKTEPNSECHYCGKLFTARHRLYRHLQMHTEQKYQCDVCKAFLKGKKSLKNHMIRHTGVKNMTCELCAATFYTLPELINHRRSHRAKERVHKCNYCEYRATTRWQIQRHEAKHSGDKSYPCTNCGAFFGSLQAMSMHQLRHLEEKKFSCPMCQKMFYRKRSISRHISKKHNSKMLKDLKRTLDVKQESALAMEVAQYVVCSPKSD